MPDASNVSLMPIIVGGLLAIGGTVIGAAGSTLVFLLQSRSEKKKRRAEKFEELVAAVYEHDHWIDNLRRIYVSEFEGEIKVSPFAKIQAISDIYFPQFESAVEELATAAREYRGWMYEVAKHKQENKEEVLAGHQKVVAPYMVKQNALLTELRIFARQEFQ
jgi:hypothetical protein